MSDRERLAKEVSDSEERYRYFVEQTAEGFYRLDSETPISTALPESDQIDAMYELMRVAECNQFFAGIYGFEVGQMTGMTLAELHGGKENEENRAALREFVRLGYRARDVDTVEVDSEGQSIYLVNNAVGIVKDGFLLGMWGTQRDVTERKLAAAQTAALEAQLHHSQKLKSLGVLAGGIAHDFNNILTSIMGNADLAESVLPPNAEAQTYLAQINRSSQRAADLCRQLLAYSGKGKFVTEAVNLSDAVEEVASMLRVSIPKKTLLNFELAQNLPAIRADRGQIQQVIMNLLTNASEALGGESGVVTIRTGLRECSQSALSRQDVDAGLDPGEYVFLSVSDTGAGMDDSTRENAFEPFFSTKSNARGLGLSAVSGILRGHKGSIKVLSKEGCGTTFEALFPAADARVAPTAMPPSRAVEWRGEGKILVVDDEADIREMLHANLQQLGFEVLQARDGEQAIRMYQQHSSDICAVFLDIAMPHLGGCEVLQELRKIDSEVRVLLASGYDEDDAISSMAEVDRPEFIQKPFGKDELTAKLREVLDANP